MSYHSTMKWNLEDEVTDEVVAEVLRGLQFHLELSGDGTYTPGAYIKFNTVDACIYFVGRVLDERGIGANIDDLLENSCETTKILIGRVLAEMETINVSKK